MESKILISYTTFFKVFFFQKLKKNKVSLCFWQQSITDFKKNSLDIDHLKLLHVWLR